MSRRGSSAVLDQRVALATGLVALLALVAAVVVTAVAPDARVIWPVPSPLEWALGAVAVALQAAALWWRRTSPRAVLLATALGMLVCGAVLGDGIALGQLAVLVAAYTLGTLQPLSRSWPTFLLATLVAGAGTVASLLRSEEPVGLAVGQGVLQGVATVAVPLVVALVVAARREIRQARESRAAALDREHDALVQAAVARERTAMARELHDIAAHHLSGIAVMTAAIGTQIDSDPDGAKAAVRQVRQQSTAVLRDLRSLVGLLREDDGASGPDRVRPESVAGIAALVEDATAVGRDVALTVLTGPRPLGDGIGPLAQLAAYRMAQEALANAARHAPGARVEVVVDDRAPDALLVTVRNDPPDFAHRGPGARGSQGGDGREGFGLVGMRERAELTGADLDVGHTADGGWQVRLRMPREARPAQDRPAQDHPAQGRPAQGRPAQDHSGEDA